MRQHVCRADGSPLALPLDKQRRLCLTEAHEACPLYVEARRARAERLAADGVVAERIASWRGMAATPPIPLALDRPSIVPFASNVSPRVRRRAQAGLVGVMGVAALALLGARLAGLGLVGGTASPAPSASQAGVAASPSTMTPAAPTPTVTPSPVPTLAISPSPSPSPSASAALTYRVQKGDTLIGIATRFGTSVTAIRSLNGLTSTVIHVGQVLRIP